MYVGIDIEQFLRDPYGSGIQRVLQQLALNWPTDLVNADFVLPHRDQFALLTPAQAGELLTIPFLPRESTSDLRADVETALDAMDAPHVKAGDLLSIYDSWLLPEVSYLPAVLERFETFAKAMPTAMIGYDTLPMTEPGNYRFTPGTAANVSEYFRHLAGADSVVCISDWSRESILSRLRRDPRKATSVVHPGGDHLPTRASSSPKRVTFVRLGTMEARKHPVEIAEAFRIAVDRHGVDAELLFIGGPSASDEAINEAIMSHVEQGRVRWIEGASDSEVHDLVHDGSVFLSIGIEGFGIPVLEAIRLGTPVLYSGVQPAAELMVGQGALPIDGSSAEALSQAFLYWSNHEAVAGLSADLMPQAVPRWSDFAQGVVSAIQSA